MLITKTIERTKLVVGKPTSFLTIPYIKDTAEKIRQLLKSTTSNLISTVEKRLAVGTKTKSVYLIYDKIAVD